jgi:DNA-directed RNA polymerase specialized sigma24 family protein
MSAIRGHERLGEVFEKDFVDCLASRPRGFETHAKRRYAQFPLVPNDHLFIADQLELQPGFAHKSLRASLCCRVACVRVHRAYQSKLALSTTKVVLHPFAYRKHASSKLFCGVRVLRGPDIDDLSQQVWLVAFTHYDEMLSSPGTARRWLSEAARRRAMDLHGSLWHCRYELVENEELAELVTDPGTRIEASAILAKMLSRLPEGYRGLVRLRRLEWEIREIAELQGAVWTTVDYWWRQACAEMVDEQIGSSWDNR